MHLLIFRQDATLKELTGLIKEVHEESRRNDATFVFRHVYFDVSSGNVVFRDIGLVNNDKPGKYDLHSLFSLKIIAGDFIDVAITWGAKKPTNLFLRR